MTGPRLLGAATASVAAAFAVVAALLVVLFTGGADDGDDSAGCLPDGAGVAPVDLTGGSLAGLTAAQTRNARIIVAVGQRMHVQPQGFIVAIATSSQEAHLDNLAHGDRDSVGLFQQRPSQGWGTVAQIMRPEYAARKFYEALVKIPGWEFMSVTVAAQKVQRSAFPDAYADDEILARRVVTEILSHARPAAAPAAAAAVAPVAAAAPAPTAETRGLTPEARRAAAFVRQHWGFTGTIGGFADRNIAGTNTKSKHASGLAIDVMGPVNGMTNSIAAYFAGPGYKAFDVDNVIHDRRIYNEARGWHAYTGVSPHTDHVHIDFRGNGVPAAAVPADATAPAPCPSTEPAAAGGATGPVVYPIKGGAPFDRHNYGHAGSLWSREHTGTDISVPCGTPVLAATAGTVSIDTTATWAGTWLVKVSIGPDSLTTWYAHMQALHVQPGQTVRAGQQIGDVGQRGNAVGCHLHFEVHPRNGSIYEDGVNPSPWLASHVGKNPNQ